MNEMEEYLKGLLKWKIGETWMTTDELKSYFENMKCHCGKKATWIHADAEGKGTCDDHKM